MDDNTTPVAANDNTNVQTGTDNAAQNTPAAGTGSTTMLGGDAP